MKIEITDRQHWIDRVDAAIRRIETERKKRDMQYEDEWASSIFCGRLIRMVRPDAKPPVGQGMTSYPSQYGWDVYGTLLDMRTGLKSMGTGSIFFGNAEINAAPPLTSKPQSIDTFRSDNFSFAFQR